MKTLNVQNLMAIHVYYLGATNTRGSRVKIKDMRFNKSITISYDYQFNDVGDIAIDYLGKIGINVIGQSEFDKGYILTTDNFTTQLS